MDPCRVEFKLRRLYDAKAVEYRRADEIEIGTDHHCWVWKRLSEITSSLGGSLRVLDVGCGTGRYFHCLNNVDLLVGLDVSPEMLEAARQPVRAELVSANRIELVCESMERAVFPSQSFDFIYSLGVFGYGCPLAIGMLDKFHEWLAPGGKVFFDVYDFKSLPLDARWRLRLRRTVERWAPLRIKESMAARAKGIAYYAWTRRQLQALVRESRFEGYEIAKRPLRSPCSEDGKIECEAARARS